MRLGLRLTHPGLDPCQSFYSAVAFFGRVRTAFGGMHSDSKKFWTSVLPKIQNDFDIANIHHITGPGGECDKEMWVQKVNKRRQGPECLTTQ